MGSLLAPELPGRGCAAITCSGMACRLLSFARPSAERSAPQIPRRRQPSRKIHALRVTGGRSGGRRSRRLGHPSPGPRSPSLRRGRDPAVGGRSGPADAEADRRPAPRRASMPAGRTMPRWPAKPSCAAAIAAHHQRLSGQQVDPSQVVVLAGAQSALFAACQCLLEPGDEVIVPEPMYVTYPATIAAAGARLVRVPLLAERGFHLDLDALAAAVTPRTRAILLNSPHNPTGAVMTRHELESRGTALPAPRSLADLRRGLRHAGLRGRARRAGRPARHGGADGHDLQPVQVACHDRLADRLADRAAGTRPACGQSGAVHALRLAHLHPGRGNRGARRASMARSRRCTSGIRRRRDAVCRRLAGLPGLGLHAAQGWDVRHARRAPHRPVGRRLRPPGCWPTREFACWRAMRSAVLRPGMSGSA